MPRGWNSIPVDKEVEAAIQELTRKPERRPNMVGIEMG